MGIAREGGVGGCEGARKGGRKGREGVMVDRFKNENETNDCDGRGTTLARQQEGRRRRGM